jgi:hypothetical protein
MSNDVAAHFACLLGLIDFEPRLTNNTTVEGEGVSKEMMASLYNDSRR